MTLYTQSYSGEYTWRASNIGASPGVDSAQGTACSPGSAAFVKGSITTVMAGSNIANDVHWVTVIAHNASTAASSRRVFVDIYTDPAGGSSWGVSPIIADLAFNGPALLGGTYAYGFPLYIPSGAAIGAALAQSTGSAGAPRVTIAVAGRPMHPEYNKVGSFVRTFGSGSVAGGGSGVAITPGAATKGSYVQVGTTAEQLWWWQAGYVSNDNSQIALTHLLDIACGSTSVTAYTVVENMSFWRNSSEQGGKEIMPLTGTCFADVASGENVFVRAASGSAGGTDTGNSVLVYAVGG